MKIAVFSFDDQYTACSHLRIVAPFRYLNSDALMWCVRVDGQNATIDLKSINSADVIVVQRGFPTAQSKPFLDNIFKSGKPVIYEIDDLLIDLPTTNLHYKTVEQQKSYLIDMLTHATAITVATDQLKKRLSHYNDNIYVLPNLINPNDWSFVATRKSAAPHLVIGYAGTATHHADLSIAEKAIMDIMNTYGNQVRLISFGCTTHNLSQLPNHEVIAFEPRYDSYIKKLQALKIDIALAPIENNAFNQCKSNIKWLEYSAAGIAGVYSDALPYNQHIQHGDTGLLVDNNTLSWFNAIRSLIENPTKRTDIAKNAYQHVMSKFSINDNSYLWADTYRKILNLHQCNQQYAANCSMC